MNPSEAIRRLTNAGMPPGDAVVLVTSLMSRGLLTDEMVDACIQAANFAIAGDDQ
jgi:hypothetical protein